METVPRLIASLRRSTLLFSLQFLGHLRTEAGLSRLPAPARAVPLPPDTGHDRVRLSRRRLRDTSNNLFIADSGTNRVVRIDAVPVLLTLVAGNGAASSNGDGGPAVAASLSHPMGVALDSAGNLFISEFQGNRIRRVDGQTGVSLLAPVPAVRASAGTRGGECRPQSPCGIAFDSTGNLYFAEWGPVRRIDAQTGIITTIANRIRHLLGRRRPGHLHGVARPIWVAVDLSGGLLISEMGDNQSGASIPQRYYQHCSGKRESKLHRRRGARHSRWNRCSTCPARRKAISSSPMAADGSRGLMPPRDGSRP